MRIQNTNRDRDDVWHLAGTSLDWFVPSKCENSLDREKLFYLCAAVVRRLEQLFSLFIINSVPAVSVFFDTEGMRKKGAE